MDLLLEVEHLDWIHKHVDEKNYARTCLYLVSCCSYMAYPEDRVVLDTAHLIYLNLGKSADALRLALRLGTHDEIEGAVCPILLLAINAAALCHTFGHDHVVWMQLASEKDPATLKQLAYMLSRQADSAAWVSLFQEGSAAVADSELAEELASIAGNVGCVWAALDSITVAHQPSWRAFHHSVSYR